MPDWNDILIELNSNGNIDEIRRRFLKKLHDITGRNIILYYSGWLEKQGLDATQTQINFRDKTGFMNVLHGLDHNKGLDLILHTPGGEVSATEALVNYLRSVFGTNIRAFVPDLAMSAGTMMACACEEIIMGKHSTLGPIDPQITFQNIQSVNVVPAHAIIEEFRRAHEEIKIDQSKILAWQPILNKYPPGFIVQCEKSIELAIKMVTKWLSLGMFKSEEHSDIKSKEVVQHLTNYTDLKSHSRPLPPDHCKELGLNIKFLEDNQELQDAVLSVHHACIHTLSGTPAYKIIENHTGKAYIAVNIVVDPKTPVPQPTNTKKINQKIGNTQKRRSKRSKKR